MGLSKAAYTGEDFLKIREFLVSSYSKGNFQKNWLIDRWNFCRYVSQSFHKTFDSWPESVGIWKDESGEIQAVVNSEGENRGEAFIQLSGYDFTDSLLTEFIEHAEACLSCPHDAGRLVQMRVNREALRLKGLLKARGYAPLDWEETTVSIPIGGDRAVELPAGLAIRDATEIGDREKGFAHGKAFGYYSGDAPDDDSAEKALASMRMAPDYDARLDLAVVDGQGRVVAFSNAWYDRDNRIGILEPLGTIPGYRRRGLGKALVFEEMNRIGELGGRRLYVGSDQEFYKGIGFSTEYRKEIWQRRW